MYSDKVMLGSTKLMCIEGKLAAIPGENCLTLKSQQKQYIIKGKSS